MHLRHQSAIVWFASALVILILCAPAPALQALGGGGRGRDIGGGPPPGAGSGDSGVGKATITRYTPAKEGQTEEGIGSLSVKTDEGKNLKLEIRPKDNLKVTMGSHEVAPEDYEKFLLPGLAVDINWNTNKLGARKTQYITTLSFETVQIEGRIAGVEEDSSIIKVFAKPSADRKWPELKKVAPKKPKAPRNPPPSSGGGGTLGGSGGSKPKQPKQPPKEKAVQAKQLRLKFLEGVSNLSDSAKQSLTVSDLRDYKDQQFSGTIVYGANGSCVLIDGSIEGEKQEKTSDAGGGGSGSGGDRGR